MIVIDSTHIRLGIATHSRLLLRLIVYTHIHHDRVLEHLIRGWQPRCKCQEKVPKNKGRPHMAEWSCFSAGNRMGSVPAYLFYTIV
jgi:hypothetical protein